ncbi:MAG: penicillin-binding protein 1C, partial [Desulfobacterales bacterium]|nr:penicillin-binding protein 1C [Desulfobacterales bacterium]
SGYSPPGYSPLLQTFWVDKKGDRAGPLCGGIKKISIALWPRSSEPWLPAKWRRNRLIPPVSDRCPDLAPLASRLQIISVSNYSLLTCPPGQKKAPLIPLEILGGQGRLYWFLNRRPLEGNVKTMALPAPGTYQLAVMDELGNGDRVTFRVIASRTGL